LSRWQSSSPSIILEAAHRKQPIFVKASNLNTKAIHTESASLETIENGSFVRSAGRLWGEGTRAKFLDAIRDGTLPTEAFERWLVQDYLFAKGLTTFQAIAAGKAPRSAQKVLIDGLVAMEAELQWFEKLASEHSLDLKTPHHPICQRYVDYLIASAYTKPPAIHLAILFGVEAAYLSGWSRLEASGPYEEYIRRWSNDLFSQYVAELHQACVDHPLKGQQDEFNTVLCHERDFWTMTYEG
jgi:thiaminase/transcriptional activator TenA